MSIWSLVVLTVLLPEGLGWAVTVCRARWTRHALLLWLWLLPSSVQLDR